jgi:type IV pilus assembly protein PilP
VIVLKEDYPNFRIGRVARCGLALALALYLTGCGGGEHEDLKKWMEASTKDLRGKVPTLPEIKPFPVVAYEAAELTDPFNPKKLEPNKQQKGGGGIQPDLTRQREPLEAYPLESLKMVGTLMQSRKFHALVQADKTLHQVRVGNYLGQNFGVITKIVESELMLKELVQDSSGDWTERTSTLQLQEKGAGK